MLEYFLLFAIALWLLNWKDHFSNVPGPSRFHLISTIVSLFTNKKEEFGFWIKENAKAYGSIYKADFLARRLLIITDAASAKRIFTEPDTFYRNDMFQNNVMDVMRYALFVIPSGEEWKRHRKLLQPGFAPSHLRHATIMSQKTIDIFIRHLDIKFKNKESAVFNMFHVFHAIALDIIGHVAFGYDFQSTQNQLDGVHDEGYALMETMSKAIRTRFIIPKLFWRFFGVHYNSPNSKKIQTYFTQAIEKVISKRKETNQAGIVQKDYEMDVLQRLLRSEDKMPMEELRTEIIGFFLAGHETTANALTCIFYEVSKRPDVQNKIFQEVSRFEQDVTFEEISQLKYVENVIKEVLRIHPIVQRTTRCTAHDTQVLGHTIPQGTWLMLNIGGLHVKEEYWNEPHVFNPDRWETDTIVPGSYLPFGDGPRNCIGQKMALLEMKVILASLFRRYRIKLVPDQEIQFSMDITYGLKKYGLEVEFEERK